MPFTILDPYQNAIKYRLRDLLAEAKRDRLAAAAAGTPVPPDTALRLCHEIRQERAGQWYSPAAWVCEICAGITKAGVPLRLSAGRQGHCRCPTVNMRYRRA